MKTERNVPEQVPAAKHPCNCATKHRNSRPRNDNLGLPPNQRNFAEYLNFGNGLVGVGKGIAAHDPLGVVFLDEAMHKESAVPGDQHNVTGNDFLTRLTLYAENIVRPNRRKHAGSECPQANGAARSEHFSCELKLEAVKIVGHDW